MLRFVQDDSFVLLGESSASRGGGNSGADQEIGVPGRVALALASGAQPFAGSGQAMLRPCEGLEFEVVDVDDDVGLAV